MKIVVDVGELEGGIRSDSVTLEVSARWRGRCELIYRSNAASVQAYESKFSSFHE